LLEILLIILSAFVVILLFVIQHLRRRTQALEKAVDLARSRRQSLATRYGQIME
jgi:hypothetical protein